MTEPLVPDIEEDIPLPKNAAEALPEMSPVEELDRTAATIQEISDKTGQPILINGQNVAEAKDVARKLIQDPRTRPDYRAMSMETAAVLRGMVAQYDFELVDDLVQLKKLVINKLAEEINEAPDSKTRIAAIKLLGEVDGVDAFKRRTETTHIIKPIEEVEKELMSVLEGIEYRVVDDGSGQDVREIE
jgi:hypothetical protein